MRHDFLDKYSRRDSPVHRVPASVKIGTAFLVVLFVVTLPAGRNSWFIGVGLFLLVTASISRVPFLFIFQRLFLLEPLVIGISLLSFLQPEGWRAFVFIITRSNLCLLTMILLTNTTRFPDILRVMTAIRIPSIFVTIMALTYRYIFVLIDETERMRRARKSRTFAQSRGGQWRVLGSMIGQLFVRSTARADRIFLAMRARGWR
jgi:cobalt/nickel transport system permease protein